LFLAFGCAFALIVPATAGAVVRLGPDLSTVQTGLGYGCQGGSYSPCSWINYASSNPDAPAVAAQNGVITEWRFRAGCCDPAQTSPVTMTLKTFRPVAGSTYIYMDPVTTGPSFVIPAGNQVISEPAVELPARVPIAAGERIGIVADYPIEFASYAAASTDFTILFNGFTYGSPYGAALAINADIEPDADGDGYGDETQDCQIGDPNQHGTECLPPPAPSAPPPPPLIVGKQGPCEGICGGGGVVFSRPPQGIPTPRGDGGIEVVLQCPPGAIAPCGGILYAELPGAKSPRASASKAASSMMLAKATYSVQPGKKKTVKLGFSSKTLKFLALKRSRRVIVTIVPKGGQPVSTTETLRFPKPKPKPRR
jgi:hypothetical protein